MNRDYSIKKWVYTSEGGESSTFSDRVTLYKGSKVDCMKWLKVKYLDLAIKAVDALDLADFDKYDISIEEDRVCYTTIRNGDSYLYISVTYVMEPKFF